MSPCEHHRPMETPTAAFVSMLMERVQQLERTNDELQTRMQKLEEQTLCLRMDKTFIQFSDDTILHWNLGEAPDNDEKHLNATAFTHQVTVCICGMEVCVGHDNHLCTVREFTETIREACIEYVKNHEGYSGLLSATYCGLVVEGSKLVMMSG